MSDAAGADPAAIVEALVEAQQLFMRHLFHRRVNALPEGATFLFVGPHPDDIEIGCGGLVRRLLDDGRTVRFVYLTDGRAAAEGGDEAAMARVRAAEAEAVARHLGLPPPLLLGVDERRFTDPGQAEALVRRLAALAAQLQPDGVFVPYWFDQHGDHRYSNLLLARALGAWGGRPTVYAYEVWSFVPPGLVVDISGQLAHKLEVIRLYASQVALFDYPTFAEIVARLHAPLAGPGAAAAEVYLPLAAERYRATVGALDLASPRSLRPGVLLTPPS